jgi:heme oxygenase
MQTKPVEAAYPEPTPVLRGKEARQFLEQLRNFRLTPEQQEFYRGAKEAYLESLERGRKAKDG